MAIPRIVIGQTGADRGSAGDEACSGLVDAGPGVCIGAGQGTRGDVWPVGYPFIQTGEVKAAGRKITTYNQTLSEIGLEQSKLWPRGTLCITIAANIAQTAFLDFDGCFPDSVVGFSTFEELMDPMFIELFIKAVRLRIEAYAPATAQKNINLTTLEELVMPICSTAEQIEMVRRLEAALSNIDAMEQQIEDDLARAKALRQSILKRAFAGRLVAQDPTDEPAHVLLERIKAEKAAAPKRRRRSA